MNADTERRILADLEAARSAGGQVYADPDGPVVPVPSDVYGREDRYRREIERVFGRAWVPVARVTELTPRSWVLRHVERAAIVVSRDEGGRLHAFHNTCRHRGSALVSADGCGERLVCPYHAWSYGLDGRLRSVPDSAAYPPDFDPTQITLGPVAVEAALGWVWVSLDPDARPLAAFLGDQLLDELTNWQFDELEHKGRLTRDGAFDWKIAVEGFLEPYHVPAVHPRSVHPVLHHRRCAMDWWGDHSRMVIALRDTQPYEADGFIGRKARAAGVEILPNLNRLQRSANLVYLVFPSMILNLLPNHAAVIHIVPVGPARSRLVLDVYGEPSTTDAQRAWWDLLVASYDDLTDEDAGAFSGVQRGLDGPYRPPLVMSHYDRRVRHFRGRLDSWLSGSADRDPARP